MTNNEYITNALRTEAPVTEEMMARFKDPATLYLLGSMLEHSIMQGNDIGLVKKKLFYGKPIERFSPAKDLLILTTEDIKRISITLNPKVIRLMHAALGLATESAEILEALYKYIFETSTLDNINLIEEGGDQFWYLAILSDALMSSFEDMQDRNIRKLKARYGDKFSEQAATERKLEVERKELETGEQETETVQAEGWEDRFELASDQYRFSNLLPKDSKFEVPTGFFDSIKTKKE